MVARDDERRKRRASDSHRRVQVAAPAVAACRTHAVTLRCRRLVGVGERPVGLVVRPSLDPPGVGNDHAPFMVTVDEFDRAGERRPPCGDPLDDVRGQAAPGVHEVADHHDPLGAAGVGDPGKPRERLVEDAVRHGNPCGAERRLLSDVEIGDEKRAPRRPPRGTLGKEYDLLACNAERAASHFARCWALGCAVGHGHRSGSVRCPRRSASMKLARLLIAALVLLGIAPLLAAQTSQGLVADPITLADLRLGIALRSESAFDESRWAAVEAAHDTYLAAVRDLEKGPIDAALPEWARCQQLFDPALVRSFLPRANAIDAKIAALDATLFDSTLQALGDDSRRAVDGLRQRRAADRAHGFLAAYHRYPFETDAADRVLSARLLSAEARVRIRQLAFDFDRQQAALRRRYADAWIERVIRIATLHRDAPIDGTQPDAQDRYRERFAAEQAAHPEVEDTSRKLVSLRERFVADAVRDLSFDARRETLANLVQRNPWSSPTRDPYGLERRFRAALRLKDLDAETAKEVRTLYETWAAEDERLQREYQKALALTTTGTQEHFDAMNAHREGGMKAGDVAHTTLFKLLGAERFEATERSKSGASDPFDDGGRNADLTSLERRAGGGPDDDPDASTRYRWNVTVPAPSADQYLVWMLTATESERAVVEAVIADREQSWNDAIAPALAQARGALEAVRGIRWQEPQHDDLESALGRCVAAYDAADAHAREVAEALRAALPESYADAIAAATLERRLEIQVADESLMGVTTSWEYELLGNVARALRTALSPEAVAALRTDLLREGDLLVAAARARRADVASLALAEVRALAAAKAAAAAGTPVDPERRNDEMLDRERQGVESRRRSTDGYRASLARLSATLSPDDARALRLAYERDVYPELFFDRRDPTPLAALLQRGLAADDDADERRAAIDEAVAAHAARRANQVFAWIDACRANPVFGREDQYEQANLRRAREFFDRQELHTRLVFALRRIVTPEEIRTVPALDRYEALVARVPSVWHER
jgi:hypothetical protein